MIVVYSILAVYFLINLFFLAISCLFKTTTRKGLFMILFIGLPAFAYWSYKEADEVGRNNIKMNLIVAVAIIVILMNLFK
jgi:hypothetical protein